MSMYISKDLLNVEKICNSGQIFRYEIRQMGNNEDNLIIKINAFLSGKDRELSIVDVRDSDVYHFICEDDDNYIWSKYFDLSPESNEFYKYFEGCWMKYEANNENDRFFFRKCSMYGKGLRILRQDPWEVLISFIISQNNNIPKIKKSLNLMCNKIPEYHFPDETEFKMMNLNDLSLGYRQEYLEDLQHKFSICEYLNSLKYYHEYELKDLIQELKKFKGVGDKVANCIALYGFHNLNAFPVDTWITKIINSKFGGDKNKIVNNDKIMYPGLLQLYMYYYAMNHKNEFK